MSPLAGERYAPEPGPLRTADAQERRRFEEEFKTNFDPTLGRELTPRERQLRERADYFLNLHRQEEAREAADKARRLAAQKAREADAKRREDADRRQRELQQKRAQFELAESLEEDLRERMGFEKQEPKWRLG
jgi:hypothetical protein